MNADLALADATRAIEQHRLAKLGGDVEQITMARLELARVKGELEKVKAEQSALAAIKTAMARPMRLGTA